MRYTEQFTVSSHDVDVNNHIKPSSLQRFMMETAMKQMRARKPSYGELFAQGQAFILARFTMEVFEQIEQFTEIEVQTWNCPAKVATFFRCFEVYCGDQLMARAHSVWGVVHTEKGTLWKADEVDISNYETENQLEMKLPTRIRLPKDLLLMQVGTKKVHYGEVDMNMHMNNTYYGDVLWNYIPDILEKEVTSVSLRYYGEAPLGEELIILMGQMEPAEVGDEQAEEAYCFRTMMGDTLNIEAVIGVRKTERWSI